MTSTDAGSLLGLRCVRWDYVAVIDYESEYKHEMGEHGFARKWLHRLKRGKPMLWQLEDALKGKGTLKGKEENTIKEEEDIDMATAMQEVLQAEEAGPSRKPEHEEQPEATMTPSTTSYHPSPAVRVLRSVKSVLASFMFPPVIALLVSLPIALIPTLKALFVYSDDTNFHPTAPDGDPPLSILYETTLFIGAASVPLGLVVLGASLAKMKIPRPVSRLPLASIISMAVIKLVILPVIGYLLVQGLVRHTTMISESDRVLRFTLVLMSCVPTGTVQVVYSSLFCPPGQQDNSALLSSYVIVQYAVWIVSSTILTALALSNIF